MSKEIFILREIGETMPGVLRVGVDLDANVVEIGTLVYRLIKRRFGIDIRSKLEEGPTDFWLDRWPEIQSIPHGPAFIEEIFGKPFIYENARPIPGAVETLNKWRSQGHQIWFMTARPEGTLGQTTLDWLEENNLPWARNRVLFSDGDRANSKARQADELDLNIFIDDHAPTVKMVGSSLMMAKLVLRYSWNISGDIGNQAIFVSSWREMDKVVQDASRWHFFLTGYE